MKCVKLLIFISIVFVSTVIADGALSDESSASKETAIEALIKIENENKALHTGAVDLQAFSKAIEGEDRLNCLEKRCVNEGQLRLTIAGPADDTPILVDLGSYSETIKINSQGNTLKFYGTLGNLFLSQIWADACRNQRLTKIEIKNTYGSPMTIRTIKMTLDNGNNLEKTIFEINQPFTLPTNGTKRYSIYEIKNNLAYQRAKVGACQD